MNNNRNVVTKSTFKGGAMHCGKVDASITKCCLKLLGADVSEVVWFVRNMITFTTTPEKICD